MPKRSRNGAGSRPARVVAPIRVNGCRSSLIERAAGPSPIMMSIWKASIAGYNTSSTTGERRWISSMNSVVRLQVGQQRGQVAGLLDHRPGSDAQADAQFV